MSDTTKGKNSNVRIPRGEAMTTKSAPEHIAEIIVHPTLDEVLQRDPHAKPFTDAELFRFIMSQRADRARFITVGEAKRAKRQGVVEEPVE